MKTDSWAENICILKWAGCSETTSPASQCFTKQIIVIRVYVKHTPGNPIFLYQYLTWTALSAIGTSSIWWLINLAIYNLSDEDTPINTVHSCLEWVIRLRVDMAVLAHQLGGGKLCPWWHRSRDTVDSKDQTLPPTHRWVAVNMSKWLCLHVGSNWLSRETWLWMLRTY